jgi:hypothetical protein
MSDDALTTCQTCGGPVRRVIYPAGIVFKGGGFYSTDHHSNGATAANGSTSADGAHAAEGAKGPAAAADVKSGATTASTPASGSNTTSSTSGT